MTEFGGQWWTSVARLGRAALVCVAASTLPACSNLIELPGSGPAPSIYDLSIPGSLPAPSVEKKWGLMIERPSAPRVLETDRIALRPSPIEIKYFKAARWSDQPAKMIQSLLAEAINGMEVIDPVSYGGGTSNARYSVAGSLLAFEALYNGTGGQAISVNVKMRLVVRDRIGSKILAHRTYTKSERVPRDSVNAVVSAFDSATTALVVEAAPWIVETVEAKAGVRPRDRTEPQTN